MLFSGFNSSSFVSYAEGIIIFTAIFKLTIYIKLAQEIVETPLIYRSIEEEGANWTFHVQHDKLILLVLP